MRQRATNPTLSLDHVDDRRPSTRADHAVVGGAHRKSAGKQKTARFRHEAPASDADANTREFFLVFSATICTGWLLLSLYRFYLQIPISLHHSPIVSSIISGSGGAPNQRTTVFQGAKILDATAKLKLPTPIIVMGLPKSGTTSISAYFRCGRIASSHFSCEVAEEDAGSEEDGVDSRRNCRLPPTLGTDAGSFPLCAVCVERNILQGRSPLEGCGPYDVFAELDSAEHPLPSASSSKRHLRSWSSWSRLLSASASDVQPLCSYPQITHLDAIHDAYPNATFILNTRPAGHWVRSISKWSANGNDKQKEGVGYLRQVLTKCDLPGLPAGIGSRDEELASFYKTHSRRIQNFVHKHPSHALIEIDIEADETAVIMEEAFGISSECWNQHNPTVRKGKEDPIDDDDDDGGGANANDALHGSEEEAVDFDIQKEKPDTALVLDYLECGNIEEIFPKVKVK